MYSRSIDGRVLTIAASGWTYDRLFVLRDRETGSLWYELPHTGRLTCIAGHYEGRTLPELPTAYEPWSQWYRDHPHTKILPTRSGRPGG